MNYVAFARSAPALMIMSCLGCTLWSNGHGVDGPPEGEAWLTLAELDNARVDVDVLQDEAEAAERPLLRAVIGYDDPVGAKDDCPVVWDLRAKIGNEELLSRAYGGRPATPPRSCERPELAMHINEDSDLGDRVLRVSDETLTFEVPIGDALGRRRLYLPQAPLGGYRVGERVRARWLPQSDLDRGLPALEVISATQQQSVIRAGDITREGDTLSFVVPPALAELGIVRLRATYQATRSDCGGACALNVSYTTSAWLQVRAP